MSTNAKRIKEVTVYSMLGALMFCSKIIMELFPNIHFLGMFTVVFTVVFRVKALFPIYIYVMINGLYAGFSMWWIPYLYIWTVLWAVVMLLPKKMPRRVAFFAYMTVVTLHGLSFGILYAPCQMLMYGLDFSGMVAWVIAGFSWDVLHAVGNFAASFLILPLVSLLTKLKLQAGI